MNTNTKPVMDEMAAAETQLPGRPFLARTTDQCLTFRPGRRVALSRDGRHYLVVRAEDDRGRLRETAPFTLFLRDGDFTRS